MPRYLEISDYNRRFVFSDDADMGLAWPNMLTADATHGKTPNPDYWPHVDGGNAALHDGSVRFVANFYSYSYPESSDSWPNYANGWPSSYYADVWNLLDKQIAVH